MSVSSTTSAGEIDHPELDTHSCRQDNIKCYEAMPDSWKQKDGVVKTRRQFLEHINQRINTYNSIEELTKSQWTPGVDFPEYLSGEITPDGTKDGIKLLLQVLICVVKKKFAQQVPIDTITCPVCLLRIGHGISDVVCLDLKDHVPLHFPAPFALNEAPATEQELKKLCEHFTGKHYASKRLA